MDMILSPCIAWGVDDIDAAVSHYVEQCGFTIKTRGEGWVELDTGGTQRIFICNEDGRTPTFELLVDDVAAALDRLLEAGWEKYGANESGSEVYAKDPFGRFFCISPKENPSSQS